MQLPRGWQLHLCAGIEFAPASQFATHNLGSLVHAGESIMSISGARLKNFWINAVSVVADGSIGEPLEDALLRVENPNLATAVTCDGRCVSGNAWNPNKSITFEIEQAITCRNPQS